jgi:cyclophilin family peptidyl-prolyl cis-trans isomerase
MIANFVIQGGGVGLDYKAKPTQKAIANEAGNGLKNLRGTVGLARASGPHSGDCQIYVNVADNADLDPLPTRWGYAVFGKIIEGMEVIDRISISPTGAMGPFKQDAPLEPVIIQKAELITEQTSVTPAPASATPASATPPPAENATPADEASKGAAPAGKETQPAAAPPPK